MVRKVRGFEEMNLNEGASWVEDQPKIPE